jgi:hypothetical protein
VYTGFWWGNLREGGHLEDPGVDGNIRTNLELREVGWGEWTGLIWLKIGIGCGLL